jgi:hypothetical protein
MSEQACAVSELKGGICPSSTVVAIKQQIHCNLNGEAVILDLSNGTYYGLDEIGAQIWAMIQEPRAITEIVDTLLEEYEVERDQCERDLLALLRELASRGLVSPDK